MRKESRCIRDCIRTFEWNPKAGSRGTSGPMVANECGSCGLKNTAKDNISDYNRVGRLGTQNEIEFHRRAIGSNLIVPRKSPNFPGLSRSTFIATVPLRSSRTKKTIVLPSTWMLANRHCHHKTKVCKHIPQRYSLHLAPGNSEHLQRKVWKAYVMVSE